MTNPISLGKLPLTDKDILAALAEVPARYTLSELREAAEIVARVAGVRRAIRFARRCGVHDDHPHGHLIVASLLVDAGRLTEAARALRWYLSECEAPAALEACVLGNEVLARLEALGPEVPASLRAKLAWWTSRATLSPPRRLPPPWRKRCQ